LRFVEFIKTKIFVLVNNNGNLLTLYYIYSFYKEYKYYVSLISFVYIVYLFIINADYSLFFPTIFIISLLILVYINLYKREFIEDHPNLYLLLKIICIYSLVISVLTIIVKMNNYRPIAPSPLGGGSGGYGGSNGPNGPNRPNVPSGHGGTDRPRKRKFDNMNNYDKPYPKLPPIETKNASFDPNDFIHTTSPSKGPQHMYPNGV
jgi:hypothetical protein